MVPSSIASSAGGEVPLEVAVDGVEFEGWLLTLPDTSLG
jgi:hypothetical protein